MIISSSFNMNQNKDLHSDFEIAVEVNLEMAYLVLQNCLIGQEQLHNYSISKQQSLLLT